MEKWARTIKERETAKELQVDSIRTRWTDLRRSFYTRLLSQSVLYSTDGQTQLYHLFRLYRFRRYPNDPWQTHELNAPVYLLLVDFKKTFHRLSVRSAVATSIYIYILVLRVFVNFMLKKDNPRSILIFESSQIVYICGIGSGYRLYR